MTDATSKGHNRWRGGRSADDKGYIRLRQLGGKGHYRYEHRAVAEQMLGRPLTSREQVHHLNGDKGDNRPENLLILGIREHALLHEEHHFVTIHSWAIGWDACRDCGTTRVRHRSNGRCRTCDTRWKRANGASW